MQGIGILSLPYTIKQGGLAALISIAAVLFIGNYTSKILVQCLYEEERLANGKIRRVRVRNTYSDLADEMHKYGGTLLNIMQIIDVTAVATLYLELSGSLLVDTFPYAGISKLSWIVISTVVLLPTIFFRNLTRIAWLSLIAVVSLIVMYFSVVWYSFGKSLMWDLSEIPPFQLQGFAVSSSIILFNFGTQFIMPGVEESMTHKSSFNIMVDITYFITGVLNTSYAFFAYITFGEDTKEFITYNMPLGLLQGLVSMLFVIKSLLSYPLMIFIVVNSLDAMQLHVLPPCYSSNPDKRPPNWAMIFRTLLVLFTLFLAIVIPHYTLLMGVTGSLTAPWLDFILPCLFHLKLKWHRLTGKQVFMDIVVIFVALFGGIVGLFYSSKALIQAYIEDFS
ncbi:vesicular inhibitory amino acid transporter-like [Anneissia japonica]|uniref:vesicular inhibitory amino acid transporter-like n=1 Tax=Anneissia japonica TaxID=1529436 RepID=UPI00142555D2|nr:vesicular inhibitory amino acid transporter-like [Anneissia japonica]